MSTFGVASRESRLRELRLRAGFTQEALAGAAGVSVRTIREIESGRTTPKPSTARLLADAMRLTSTEFRWLSGHASDPAATPVELPATVPGFTGRTGTLRILDATARAGATGIGLHGMPGVGKTAVAVHAAHTLAAEYPDGQLFVTARGPGGAPVEADVLLRRVLRGMGVTEPPPDADPDETAARYRSELARRRLLVLFDDVAGPEQVTPVLPGAAGSLVMVTSRRNLSGVFGLTAVPLAVPPEDEAAAMLRGGAPGRADSRTAAAIVALCGRLPLAVRLAAARLLGRPQWTAVDLLERIGVGDRLLDELDLGSRSLTGPLRASVDALDHRQRRLLRLLGLLPTGEVDAAGASALAGLARHAAERLLESLVDVHLLESDAPGRYRPHVLVGHLARRIAVAEETARARREALARWSAHGPARSAGAPALLAEVQLTVPG